MERIPACLGTETKNLNDLMSSYEEVVEEIKVRVKELEQEVEMMEERIKDKSAQEVQRKDFGRGSGQGRYNFGLSLRGVSRSRSTYIGNPQGGGEGANNERKFGGGSDDNGFGGGSDASMGSSSGSMRRFTDRENLASVIRSVPIARIF